MCLRMNEDLAERVGHSRSALLDVETDRERRAPRLNRRVREYFETPAASDGAPWLHRPELPLSEELLDLDPEGQSVSAVELEPNRPQGQWDSMEEYLKTHYELLREDAVKPLREAVQNVRQKHITDEGGYDCCLGLYDKVHICGITPSTRGLAIRVTFSLRLVGKKIQWAQSKRLLTGSIVALTPKSDIFRSKALVATVAARSLKRLDSNPPEIDLFFARADEQEIDPATEFIMVEHRSSLFPLSRHLLFAETNVAAPEYLMMNPYVDMSAVFRNSDKNKIKNFNLLGDWPHDIESSLDSTQISALRRILTKSLAVVQGPPGTGKTHVSVEAIKVFLANRRDGDPPLIVTSQTNHALDQLLLHVNHFEPDFIRLGSRSRDFETIRPRTLFEINKVNRQPLPPGSYMQSSIKAMKKATSELQELLAPLEYNEQPLDVSILQKFHLLSEAQAKSLDAGASRWVDGRRTSNDEPASPFATWLGRALIPVAPKQTAEDFGFDFEEADLEVEQLMETEAENGAKDEDDDSLSGTFIPVADNFTCRETPGMSRSKVLKLLQEQDLWKLQISVRPAIYRYLQYEMKQAILVDFRKKARHFASLTKLRRIGTWERDENVLKECKIIGMTTTGLSKYRGLIAALEPKIILIEEAAEIIEAPVAVACLPSVQHLILVGDHKQLRPHCNVKEYEDADFFLNVSLFERLINNRIELSVLKSQRRMIPEIRRLLRPIYGKLLEDHPSVRDPVHRPNVPGMGAMNSYFFTHDWPERKDDLKSAINPSEASMIAGFVEYLLYNGVSDKEITLLTFYNGQRKRLRAELQRKGILSGRQFKIVTVDSYQGEENQIVILSLVRNNSYGNIGFLDVDNRVCVALSRAQRAFYIFGNAALLSRCSETWRRVIKIMVGMKIHAEDQPIVAPTNRVRGKLPVCCSKHGNITEISCAEDWENIFGGCTLVKCEDIMPCGHRCPLMCHPFAHGQISCAEPCDKNLPCGHKCSSGCGRSCACHICEDNCDDNEHTSNSGTESGESTTRNKELAKIARRGGRKRVSKRVGGANGIRDSDAISSPISDKLIDISQDGSAGEAMQQLSVSRSPQECAAHLPRGDGWFADEQGDWSRAPSLLD